MIDLAELRRLEAAQKKVARRLCELMDDEWRLGRRLYLDTAKEILDDIALPELLAKAEAHDALVEENEMLSHAADHIKALESLCRSLRDDAMRADNDFCSMEARAEQAEDRIRELLKALEWQGMENAPLDGTDIVGLDTKTGTRHVTSYTGSAWYDPDSHYYSEAPDFNPTFWLPLPPHGGVDVD